LLRSITLSSTSRKEGDHILRFFFKKAAFYNPLFAKGEERVAQRSGGGVSNLRHLNPHLTPQKRVEKLSQCFDPTSTYEKQPFGRALTLSQNKCQL
jgi:hypothetical protein